MENRACSSDGRCLEGYTCTAQRICVRIGSETTDLEAETIDAGSRTSEVDASQPITAAGSIASSPAGSGAAGASGSSATLPAGRPAAGAGGSAGNPAKPAMSGAGGSAGRATPAPAGGAGGSAAGAGGSPPAPEPPPPSAAGTGGECALGEVRCDGSCRALAWDARNCGTCGNVCAVPEGGSADCLVGVCTLRCDAPRLNCGGRCVDAQTDPENCGLCGVQCGPAQRCTAGTCALLGQSGPGPLNLLQLQLVLSQLNVPIALLANLLGVDPSDFGGAKISYDDLIELGVTREQLDEQNITLDELERIGIDVSAERERRARAEPGRDDDDKNDEQ